MKYDIETEKEGYAAYRNGQTVCPYPLGTKLYHAWFRGYRLAEMLDSKEITNGRNF